MQKENLLHEHWILLAAILNTLIYVVIAVAKGKLTKDSLGDIITVLLTTASMLTGISLGVKILLNHQELLKSASLEESDIFYFVIGGGAIAWLAFWELKKKYKEL